MKSILTNVNHRLVGHMGNAMIVSVVMNVNVKTALKEIIAREILMSVLDINRAFEEFAMTEEPTTFVTASLVGVERIVQWL